MRLSKVVCPFCFEKFALHNAHFRCTNPNDNECPEEHDEIYAKYLNNKAKNVIKKKAFRIDSLKLFKKIIYYMFPPKAFQCTVCSHKTKTRLCPFCHNELPLSWGETKDYIIAIIGGRDTGKSHFIASLIHVIKNKIGPQFGADLLAENDDTTDRYKKDFYRPIFEERKLLEATQKNDSSVKKPMIFRFSLEKRRVFKSVKSVVLVFFDTAGENLSASASMEAENKYILRSSGIIFLLDPLQIFKIRNKLETPTLPAIQKDSVPEELVDRLIRFFEKEKSKTDQKIKTPTAFCFSKIDELQKQGVVPPKSVIYGSDSHFGYFNEANADSVHMELQNLSKEWMDSGFTQKLTTRFKKYQFFGISSLGQPPSAEGKIEEVKPLRVEDPFLWLLAVFKAIPTKKNTDKSS